MNRSTRLLAALAMIAVPSVASAQSITGSIAASADIATVFSFGAPTALNFGSIPPGTAANASGFIPLSRNVGVIYSLPDGATTGQLTGPGGNLLPSYTCGVGTTSAAMGRSQLLAGLATAPSRRLPDRPRTRERPSTTHKRAPLRPITVRRLSTSSDGT